MRLRSCYIYILPALVCCENVSDVNDAHASVSISEGANLQDLRPAKGHAETRRQTLRREGHVARAKKPASRSIGSIADLGLDADDADDGSGKKVQSEGPAQNPDHTIADTDAENNNQNGLPEPLVPTKTGYFPHSDQSRLCSDCGGVYYKFENGIAWALVMKLSKQDFCYNSSKWGDPLTHHHEKLANVSFPQTQAYDAKGHAFHRLQGVRSLRFTNQYKDEVTVDFASSSTPEMLMTTNMIQFAAYPDWDKWKQVFVPKWKSNAFNHSRAPMFMRAGQPVSFPTPLCRESGQMDLGGCAQPCTFCFFAQQGNDSCPESAEDNKDDATIGIGNNYQSCNVHNGACSTSTHLDAATNDTNRILVWAKVPPSEILQFETNDNFGNDVADQVSAQNDQVSVAAATQIVPKNVQGHLVDAPPAPPPVDVDLQMLDSKAIPTHNGLFKHEDGNVMCDNCSDVFYQIVGNDAWALVMKLSKNDFCYGSEKWTDGLPFNAAEMLDDTVPPPKEYDAKSVAFHHLQGVTAIKLESSRGETTTVDFAMGSTPETLMTLPSIPMKTYPEWSQWNVAFGTNGSELAPMFVRGGEAVKDPDPPCRNQNVEILGCGQPCMFCYVASKGTGCPAAGSGDDYGLGIGHTGVAGAGCPALDNTDCSASTPNSGPNQVLVWAKVPAKWLFEFGQGR